MERPAAELTRTTLAACTYGHAASVVDLLPVLRLPKPLMQLQAILRLLWSRLLTRASKCPEQDAQRMLAELKDRKLRTFLGHVYLQDFGTVLGIVHHAGDVGWPDDALHHLWRGIHEEDTEAVRHLLDAAQRWLRSVDAWKESTTLGALRIDLEKAMGEGLSDVQRSAVVTGLLRAADDVRALQDDWNDVHALIQVGMLLARKKMREPSTTLSPSRPHNAMSTAVRKARRTRAQNEVLRRRSGAGILTVQAF